MCPIRDRAHGGHEPRPGRRPARQTEPLRVCVGGVLLRALCVQTQTSYLELPRTRNGLVSRVVMSPFLRREWSYGDRFVYVQDVVHKNAYVSYWHITLLQYTYD